MADTLPDPAIWQCTQCGRTTITGRTGRIHYMGMEMLCDDCCSLCGLT